MEKLFCFLFLGLSILGLISCNSGASSSEKVFATHSISSTKNVEPKMMISSSNPVAEDSLILSKNKLTGRFDYTKDKDFVKILPEHCTKPGYMHKEAYSKFVEMYNAAKKEGVILRIVSGTRSFSEQCGIWNRKWEKYIIQKDSIETMKTILQYSSMPSTSRHHWGTDIDINNLQNSYFENGQGLKEYKWLCKNASNFGFCQVYTSKLNNKRTGYEMEKWHWSYLPVATRNLKFFKEQVTYSDVSGFKGSHLAEKIKAISDYVYGIDSACIK